LVKTQKLFEMGDFSKYPRFHGLSIETTKFVQSHVRQFLGIANLDSPRVTDLFHPKYCRSRYSFGYPACPNLEDQAKIFRMLGPAKSTGKQLAEGYHLELDQSTNAFLVHHPQAKYFAA
jgi:5-methyltetrahydrofolate--homocysteine methyltransferase